MKESSVHTLISQGLFDEFVAKVQEDEANLSLIHTENGLSPIHYAVIHNNLAVLAFCLAKGTDPNTQAADGATALHYAARTDNHEAARLLLKYHANVNIRDENGFSALDTAVGDNRLEILRQLLTAGADFEHTGGSKKTPLALSQRLDNPEMTAMLTAEPHVRDRSLTWLCACKIASEKTIKEQFLAVTAPLGTEHPFHSLEKMVSFAPFRSR